MTDLETTAPLGDDDAEARDIANNRRRLLRQLAAGGAGAAVGVVALGGRASAGDEGGGAVGGNALELGSAPTNTSTTPTSLAHDPATAPTEGPSALSVGKTVPAGDAPFPANVGGYGNDKVVHGLHGSTTEATGYGVVAANLADAAATETDPVPAGLAVAAANGAQVLFVKLDGAVVGPTPGAHVAGELYCDSDGTLWFTVPVPPEEEGGEAGVRFVTLAGTTTAGALHLLEAPVRIADTREGDDPMKPEAGANVEFDTTKDLDGEDSGVPASATAVLANVSVATTENRGFISVAAKGVEVPDEPEFATSNWVGDDRVVNASVTTRTDADGIIQCQLGPEGGANIIVDIVGFYL